MTPLDGSTDRVTFAFAGAVFVIGGACLLAGALLVRVYVFIETNFGVPL